MFKIIIYVSVILSLNACTNSIEFGNDTVDSSRPKNPIIENVFHTEFHQYESSNKQVDILLVIDNSTSMIEEHTKMIQKFQDNFIPYLRGLDWRIGILTTDPRDVFDGGFFGSEKASPSGFGGKLLKLNANNDLYLHRDTPNLIPLFQNTIKRIGCNLKGAADNQENQAFCSEFNGYEQPFNSILKSIQKRNTDNQNFFRDKAHLVTIVLSDEDEDDISNLEATDLVKAVNTQWPNKVLRSYSISVLPGDNACKEASSEDFNASFGRKLFNLSQLTGGTSLSICSSNYAPIFNTISTSVYDSFLLKINLEKEPIPGHLQLTLDPEPNYSFHYVVQNQQILFKEPLLFDTTFIIKYLTPNVQK